MSDQAELEFAKKLGIRPRKAPEPSPQDVMMTRFAESSEALAQACHAVAGVLAARTKLEDREEQVRQLQASLSGLEGEREELQRSLVSARAQTEGLRAQLIEATEKFEAKQNSDDNAEQERLRGELRKMQKEFAAAQRRAAQAEQKVVALAGRKPVAVKKPPSDIASEIRRDPAGLLAGMVLRASGYDDINVTVRRGPNDEVLGLNFT